MTIDSQRLGQEFSELNGLYLVKAIVSLARGLDQKTIAEGVEDEETLALLRDYGVDYAQGYHLGRPAPMTQTNRLTTLNRTDAAPMSMQADNREIDGRPSVATYQMGSS